MPIQMEMLACGGLRVLQCWDQASMTQEWPAPYSREIATIRMQKTAIIKWTMRHPEH